jgi:UDP-N-acetylmuramoyl-L-alanyl-D-glutamate--2,6-diaminopimelate ligase
VLESPLLRAPGGPSGGSSVPHRPPAMAIGSPSPRLARTRPLSALLASVPEAEVRGSPEVAIQELAYRSTDVGPGCLFFSVPGGRLDGHRFAAEAVARGAPAIVLERWLGDTAGTQVRVSSVRRAMGPLSAAFFDHPSRRMTVVGVTGTNGKTTTTYLLESIFRAAGLVPGVVGTTGVRIDGRTTPFERTTPEAPDLQRVLSGMLEQGVSAVAMEVSSHGLDQHRVDGTRYRCAVFTNLSQDHLDYHGTLEAYFQAKSRLFSPDLADRAAVNGDVPEGRAMAELSSVPTTTFGMSRDCDLVAEDASVSTSGLSFTADGIRVVSSLRGTFNLYNCLGAVAAAREVGLDDGSIAAGIGAVTGVPGRFDPVDAGQPFQVFVDYAHTPDSLENVLGAARDLAPGRVIVVFGCGGDRDRGKRPAMGEVATRLADLAIVTSDNPRTEEPMAIITEIEEGARRGGGAYILEADRRGAIRMALEKAGPGDIVVIAGKGHETGQEFGNETVPFDDRVVASEEILRLAGEGGR